MNEIITDEKDVSNEIFLNCFRYQKSLFSVKVLISAKQAKNDKLVNNINDGLINLRNDNSRKEISHS